LRAPPFAAWDIAPLPSMTNRCFRLRAPGRDFVLRLPGTGTERYVSRAAELHNAAAAAAAGMAPPYLYGDERNGIMLTEFMADARPMTAGDFSSPAAVAQAARLLRQLHESGVVFRSAIEPFAVVDRYLAIATHGELARLRQAAEASRAEFYA